MGNCPLGFFVRGVQETPYRPLWAITWLPQELEGKTPLLKTLHTSDLEELSWN